MMFSSGSNISFGLLVCVAFGCGSEDGRRGSATPANGGDADSPIAAAPVPAAMPSDLAGAFVGDPFSTAERLDAKDLFGASDALVAVVREIDGRVSQVRPGYVFAGDDQSSYIIVDDFRGGMYSAADPTKPLQFTYRALVGWGPGLRSVRLEEVRRYVRPNGMVLAAAKEQLPEPLVSAGDDIPQPGRRLHIVGHSFANDYSSASEMIFALTVDSAEVILLPESIEKIRQRAKATSTFVIACAPEVQIREGLVLDEQTKPIAIALDLPSTERGPTAEDPKLFACFPIDRLYQFAGPQLMHYGASLRPAGDGAEADVVVQCLEPQGPLRNLRLYAASQWLELAPEPRATPDWRMGMNGNQPVDLPQPILVAPYASRPTKVAIVDDNWIGAPADVQEIKLTSAPTDSPLFTNQWSRPSHPKAPFPDGQVAAWPGLATYRGKISLAKMPESKFIFVQCVYDDNDGKPQVLGQEQWAYVGFRPTLNPPASPTRSLRGNP